MLEAGIGNVELAPPGVYHTRAQLRRGTDRRATLRTNCDQFRPTLFAELGGITVRVALRTAHALLLAFWRYEVLKISCDLSRRCWSIDLNQASQYWYIIYHNRSC